jgi:hypothetical protein
VLSHRHSVLFADLALGVTVIINSPASNLIQNQNIAAPQHRTSETEELALSLRPLLRVHVAVQAVLARHSFPQADLLEGCKYLCVGAAGVRVHVGSVCVFKEEGVLGHRV